MEHDERALPEASDLIQNMPDNHDEYLARIVDTTKFFFKFFAFLFQKYTKYYDVMIDKLFLFYLQIKRFMLDKMSSETFQNLPYFWNKKIYFKQLWIHSRIQVALKSK